VTAATSLPQDDFLHNDPLRKLTPLGVKQAHIAGKTIARLIEVEKRRRPDLKVHVYCSDMARAHETGSIIHGHLKQQVEQEKGTGADGPLPLHVDSMLREGAPMWPEGYAGNWAPEPHEFYEEAARIEAAFRKHIHRASPSQDQDSVTVLVCHGNVIRCVPVSHFCCVGEVLSSQLTSTVRAGTSCCALCNYHRARGSALASTTLVERG